MGPEYKHLQGLVKSRGSTRSVRRPLSQHLRVLGGPRGNLPHRRRPVHPALRLLPDRHRQAAAAGPATSRAAWPSRCRPWACATPRSPASHATTCPTAGRGCTETVRAIHELNPDTGVRTWSRTSTASPTCCARFRVAAGGAGPQRGDGAADLQADPAGVPLRPVPGGADRGPRLRAGHQVQPDPGHGRDPRGGLWALRDLHDAGCELVTITQYLRPRCATTLSSGGSSPRSSSSSRTRPTRSGSPACCPARSCVRPTEPVGCTVRPWTPARASRPVVEGYRDP